nr:prolyl oligopeptidase family serine peptidase [Nostoc sp. CreGUA01]
MILQDKVALVTGGTSGIGRATALAFAQLENDVRKDQEVAAWVESQNKVTNAHLNTLPGREIFRDRLKQLYNYERFSIPVKKGGRYFYLHNSGLQNQQVLYVRDSVDGAGRVLIDPNRWAEDGAIALAEWSVSDDGKRVAYAVQDSGTDWRRIRVLDVDTGKRLDDEVKWARFTSIAWTQDGSGFFYSRYPEPKQGTESQANVANHAVYFHAIADVVPQQDSVLGNASLVAGRLLISYLADVKTEVRRYTLDSKADGVVKLPGIGTASGFKGKQSDPETFFIFTSFNAPDAIYRYDVASNTARVWAQPKIAIDLSQIAVEQCFYRSKDGTRVPMFIVRRKDVTRPAPTLFYAYGGYGIPLVPAFSPDSLGWVEQGGVYAIANIRGGSEYGQAWHEAGRRQNKQNVFDDFIAAGEYLKAQGITQQNGLAIQGGSNGGLLIGAVVNQRPDLFAASLPQVDVMDIPAVRTCWLTSARAMSPATWTYSA